MCINLQVKVFTVLLAIYAKLRIKKFQFTLNTPVCNLEYIGQTFYEEQ